jgi:hypothetical protein
MRKIDLREGRRKARQRMIENADWLYSDKAEWRNKTQMSQAKEFAPDQVKYRYGRTKSVLVHYVQLPPRTRKRGWKTKA